MEMRRKERKGEILRNGKMGGWEDGRIGKIEEEELDRWINGMR